MYTYIWHILLSFGLLHIRSLFYSKMMLFLLTIVCKCGCQDECWLNSYFHMAQCEDCSWLGYSWAFERLTVCNSSSWTNSKLVESLFRKITLPLCIAMCLPQCTGKLCCLKLECSTPLKPSFWHNCWQFPHFGMLYDQSCQQQFHDLLVPVDLWWTLKTDPLNAKGLLLSSFVAIFTIAD